MKGNEEVDLADVFKEVNIQAQADESREIPEARDTYHSLPVVENTEDEDHNDSQALDPDASQD